ncbi:hypothetical protein N9P15_04770 [Planktomarina sp.]|nr:hypothetical protein [Planktomarina sp.]MDA9099734.1 hypothetical protein [Planktomarina sp.]MDA9238392.1 hypothetical protein [Planktomarina sp.]
MKNPSSSLQKILMKNIPTQQHFLNFEVVLAHCEKRVTEPSLKAAINYGRKMDFFDSRNKLSQSGELLAEILKPQYA